MHQKTAKATTLCLPRVTAEDGLVSDVIFCWTYLPRDTRLLPPKLDQHRVNLDLATLATGQAGLPQQPHSSVAPCPHCCLETAGKMAEALHLQLLKISLSTKRQELLAAWAIGRAKVKQWGNTGEGITLLLGPHEWAPFCLVPPGACKHQPPTPSHQLPPSKRRHLSMDKGNLF